jgi:hypothetical protein
MIRRLQKGHSAVAAIHANEGKERIRFCSRCQDLFGVQARLGPRIRIMGTDGKIEPPQPGDENYLSCRNCNSTFAKYETKVEPELSPIKEPSDGKQAKSQGIEKKRKTKGRGSNPRLGTTRDDIKDEDLRRELRSGAMLVSYYSTDPM